MGRGWLDGNKAAPPGLLDLLDDPDDDCPLSRYPPGMRTERRDLGVALGDVLVTAAAAVVGDSMPDCRAPRVATGIAYSQAPVATDVAARHDLETPIGSGVAGSSTVGHQ